MGRDKGGTRIYIYIYIYIYRYRNGNGLSSGWVFAYPDPTRGFRPTTRTWLNYLTDFFYEAQTYPAGPCKPRFLKQALNSTSNPRPNNQSQKSLLFKSPQPHPNKKNKKKKSHFSILKPKNNQTNGGDFGSIKK